MDGDLTPSALMGSPTAVGGHVAGVQPGGFDWQRELDTLVGRLARGRQEEANAIRRGAEEAERNALRRAEDVERRMTRVQAEESHALQGFLGGWNAALEARLERVRAQSAGTAGRLDTMEQHTEEVVEQVRTVAREATQRADEVIAEAVRHLEGAEERARAAAEVVVASTEARLEARFTAACRENEECVASRLGEIDGRLEAVMVSGSATAQALAELEEMVKSFASRVKAVEATSESLSAHFRSELASSDDAVRKAIESSERRAGEGSSKVLSELRAFQGQCEVKMEATSRFSAESHARLESELRGLADDAAERAELAAANLDSKVAGALDAVIDARVSRSAKDCHEEAVVAMGALELRLKSSDAALERLTREEARVTKTASEEGDARLKAELAALHQELNEACSAERFLAIASERKQPWGQGAQGPSYEWVIPRCLQRVRYLSMSTDAGLWLDSDTFSIGSMGGLMLRLYPRGIRGGDGQCAVALKMAKEAAASFGLAALPKSVDFSVDCQRQRGMQRADEDTDIGVLWFADSLGELEKHVAKDVDELLVRVELPCGSIDAAAGVQALLSDGVAEELTAPHGLRALQQRLSAETGSEHRSGGGDSDSVVAWQRPKSDSELRVQQQSSSSRPRPPPPKPDAPRRANAPEARLDSSTRLRGSAVEAAGGRTNPFEVTNPFENSFSKSDGIATSGAVLVGSPTPSFASLGVPNDRGAIATAVATAAGAAVRPVIVPAPSKVSPV